MITSRVEVKEDAIVITTRVPLRRLFEPGEFQGLRPRQQEVFMMVVLDGMSNKEIAQRLNVAERTVKYHMGRILNSFGVHSRAELLRLAHDVEGCDAHRKNGLHVVAAGQRAAS